MDASFTGGFYILCKARLSFKPDTELSKKYNPGNSEFINCKPIQAKLLQKYKFEFNGDEKEVGVPDECKKSASKFEAYFLQVFNKTLNDRETLVLTVMDDAEMEETFDISAFNSDEESLIFIGKIKTKKIKRMKSQHVNSNNAYNSDATNNAENDSKQSNNNNNNGNEYDGGLLFPNFVQDGEGGGHVSEHEIAEPAPAQNREYRKLYRYIYLYIFFNIY